MHKNMMLSESKFDLELLSDDAFRDMSVSDRC